jgi:hypothetical protein
MTERQKAIAYADKEFSLYIRARDGNRCYTCSVVGACDCGHFVTRAKLGTRWDEENAHAQCRLCNNIHEENPAPFESALKRDHGPGFPEELVRRGNTITKLSAMEIREIGRYFRIKRLDLERSLL